MIARLFSSSRWKATLIDFLNEHLIHRDEDFMVIHKPAGLLTVPGKTPDLQDCLINRLLEVEPKTLLIHRLDRDTSGILVFGLSNPLNHLPTGLMVSSSTIRASRSRFTM